MKEVAEAHETWDIFYNLAREIRGMTEEERLLYLRKIVRAELKGNKNRLWLAITKKMLIDKTFIRKVLLGEIPAKPTSLNHPENIFNLNPLLDNGYTLCNELNCD